MTDKLYHYKATLLKVVDGDTVWLRIDLGFELFKECSCRLYGINTPELRKKEEKEAAIKAMDYLQSLFNGDQVGSQVGDQVYVYSNKLDKYGRPLVTIHVGDVNVNARMVEEKLAVPYLID